MSDYNVETINDGLNEFNVEFHGPKESTVLHTSYAFSLHIVLRMIFRLHVCALLHIITEHCISRFDCNITQFFQVFHLCLSHGRHY